MPRASVLQSKTSVSDGFNHVGFGSLYIYNLYMFDYMFVIVCTCLITGLYSTCLYMLIHVLLTCL